MFGVTHLVYLKNDKTYLIVHCFIIASQTVFFFGIDSPFLKIRYAVFSRTTLKKKYFSGFVTLYF
jgi:hypothetical protein